MKNSTLWMGLRNEVRRHAKAYAAGRERYPALAPYATVNDVLAVVEASGSGAGRAEVLSALASEQRRAPHPLWQALLLIAFEGMLRTLRARLGKPKDADLDQEVVLAFLNAVRAVRASSIGAYLTFALRRETAIALFRARGLQASLEAFDDETYVPPEEVDRPQSRLLALALDESGPELAPALLATCEGDETLRGYVDRTHAELPDAERQSTYDRLRRQRRQLANRLRERAA